MSKVIRSLVGHKVTWEGRTDKLEGKCQRSIGHWWVVGSAWEERTDKLEGKCQRSIGDWWVLGSALEGRTDQIEGVKGH